MRWLLLPTIILAVLFGSHASAGVTPKGKCTLEPLDFKGVTLDDGLMRRQFDDTREYYLRIPNDDLLKGFRSRAALPSPGSDLAGWYGSDTFHIFGQVLSGLSRMHAATGDPACKAKVDLLVSEWGKCIEKDGYFFFSRKPNAPHYVYDKMVCGLVDAHLYCDNQEALRHLSWITDWAIKNLDRSNAKVFNSRDAKEWYTLSENLYRAYLTTGDIKYRDFAKVWELTPYWNHYAAKTDIFRGEGSRAAYHAYSHVNTLSGAGAAYIVTGQKHYLDTIRNAYDYLQENQVYATGGYGPNEHLIPPTDLAATLDNSVNHFETQCGSWGAFKLCKYLISCTGDARYGDWVECLVLNGIGTSITPSANGNPFYYSNYSIYGASKRLFQLEWACCAGTRPQAIADYYDLVYFKNVDGLCVNLFTPSTVKWNHKGSEVAVQQITRFPESNTADFVVRVSRPTALSIKVRKPGWLSGPMTATINGKPITVKGDSRHWAEFVRTWRDGDRLSIRLPMSLSAHRFPASSPKPYPAAIMYGPVTMAVRSPSTNPAAKIDFGHLSRCLTPSPGEPLTFHLTTDPDVVLRPFYAFCEGQQYYLYMDPSDQSSSWHRHMHNQAVFTGNWGETPQFRMTKEPGSSVSFAFEGTGVRWVGNRFDDAGQAEVRIDGEVAGIVDQYGPAREIPFRWEKLGLSPGKHTITLTLLADKNPSSSDTYINVTAFDIMEK